MDSGPAADIFARGPSEPDLTTEGLSGRPEKTSALQSERVFLTFGWADKSFRLGLASSLQGRTIGQIKETKNGSKLSQS